MVNIKLIYNTFQKLEYINFDPRYISFNFDDILLSESCSKIESVVLKGSGCNYDKVVKILSQCKNIKNLEADHLERMHPKFFVYLADNFSNLEYLSVKLMHFSHDNELSRNENMSLEKENKELANINLKYMVDQLFKLKNINISYCEWLNCDTLKYIYSNCKKNEHLYLIDKFPDRYYQDDKAVELIESITNPLTIKNLDINYYLCLYIIPFELLFSKIKNLETLTSYQYDLEDDDITTLVKYCKNINKLSLIGSTDISNISILNIANTFKGMTELNLDTEKITDLSMVEIFKNCTLLKSIHINKCATLTDLSFIELVNCKFIESIFVNEKISNECLRNIILNCNHLESIGIIQNGWYRTKKSKVPFSSENDIVTFELILWMIKNGHSLKSIVISKQNSLTNRERRILLDRYGSNFFPDFVTYLNNNRGDE